MTPTIGQNDTPPTSQRVIEEVAAVTGMNPLEMEPLYHQIDPDSLNSLFSDADSTTSGQQGHIIFPLAGCQVTVWADGSVDVEPEVVEADIPPVNSESSAAESEVTSSSSSAEPTE